MHRAHVALFALVCLVGATVAVALAAVEAVRTPAVVVSVAHKSRAGLTTTLTIAVHNTTARSRCAVVRVAARDRDGHDLARTTAATALPLAPHERRRVTAQLTLTRRQYAEKLYAFVPSQQACGAR